YVSLLGLDLARAEAARLEQQAQAALAHSGLSDTRALQALSGWVLQRQN
ncbi:MAG: hypothetical protein RI998_870, partial [Pseudomonadota bacterium]